MQATGDLGQLIAGLGIGLGAAASGITWAVKTFAQMQHTRKNGGGSDLSTIIAMASEARRDFQTHTAALQGIVANLAAMNERLNHLPTREDLAEGLAKNRHDIRNEITRLTMQGGKP